MQRRRQLAVLGSLAMNAFLSWTLLPFVIPPFRSCTLGQLGEAALWQGIGAVGWPFALAGMALSLLFDADSARPGPLLLMLIYPATLVLVALSLTSTARRRWPLVLAHVVLLSSFAAVWFYILNGYEFMPG